MPDREWRKPEIRHALRERDAGALLSLVQKHAGVSQARHAETLTGHAEISRVFTVQAEANTELREQAGVAARIDVLAVRALGLIALNDSLLRGPLAAREAAVDVRVLLLDPDSPAAAIRAGEIGESPGSFGAGIRLALGRLAKFAGHPVVRMRTALYGSLPTWRMLVFDGTLYLSAFASSSEGHRSGMYKLTAAGDGVLHAGFLRQFDDMWRMPRAMRSLRTRRFSSRRSVRGLGIEM